MELPGSRIDAPLHPPAGDRPLTELIGQATRRRPAPCTVARQSCRGVAAVSLPGRFAPLIRGIAHGGRALTPLQVRCVMVIAGTSNKLYYVQYNLLLDTRNQDSRLHPIGQTTKPERTAATRKPNYSTQYINPPFREPRTLKFIHTSAQTWKVYLIPWASFKCPLYGFILRETAQWWPRSQRRQNTQRRR